MNFSSIRTPAQVNNLKRRNWEIIQLINRHRVHTYHDDFDDPKWGLILQRIRAVADGLSKHRMKRSERYDHHSHLFQNPIRPSIKNVLDLLNRYLIARDFGLEKDKAKQFAVYSFRKRKFASHGDTALYSKRYKTHLWYIGYPDFDFSKEFDEVVLAALDKLPKFKARKLYHFYDGKTSTRQPRDDFPYDEKPDRNLEVLDFVLKHARDRKKIDQFARAAKIYEGILEMKVPHLLNSGWMRIHKEWLKIKRGEDLFIKGFGRFDIKAAMKDVNDICDVLSVQAYGYGFQKYVLNDLLSEKDLKEYFTRNIQWIKEHKERSDEIGGCLYKIKAAIELDPNAKLEQILDEYMKEQHEMALRNRLSTLERLGKVADFEWVKKLEPMKTPLGQIKAIQSLDEIVDNGVKLRNCIAGYTEKIATRECLLLVLLNEDGTPYACGEVRYDPIKKRWEWGQRLGVGNQKLDEETKRIFESYPLIGAGIYNVENGMKLNP